MAEILGLGLSHYPPLSMVDDDMAGLLRNLALQDPSVPDNVKDPANWPQLAREEWADDQGRASAADHRSALVEGFDQCRQALDEFRPDVVVIWGDDQYENFREDIIPPYAVLCLPDLEVKPWAHAQDSSAMRDRPNAWNEPEDTTFKIRGRPDIGKHLVAGLLESGMDVSYAYKTLHHPSLPHAFLNAVLYLDYHRRGFDYPIVPFPINCYGRRVISYRGFTSNMDDIRELDPPAPRPDRMMDVGAATARVLSESPWRVALVASSSWSHAFLTDSTYRLRPDTVADKRLYDSLMVGDIDAWRNTSLEDLETAGQQEVLNWFPLLGAMETLNKRPTWSKFVETDVFNSNKVFAIFE